MRAAVTRDPRQPRDAPFVWALLGVGLALLALTLWCDRSRPFVGSPDQAAYVHQAERLLDGHGCSIAYVQHFYRRYPQVEHPEDHYGVGQGVLVALSFLLAGRSDWAATLPSAVLGALALPLLVYAAARACGAAPWWALGAGLTAMLGREVLQHERMALCDLQFAALAVAAWVAAVRAGRSRCHWAWRVLPGAALAVAYYLKPAALLLLPGLALAAWLAEEDSSRRERVVGLAWLMGTFLALVSPWLVRNAVDFGSPLYSANQYIGPATDYTRDFQVEHFRKVWWVSVEQPWGYGDLLGRFGATAVRQVVTDRLREALWSDCRWAYTLALLLCPLLCGRRRTGALLLAYAGLYALALCALFTVHTRYVMLLPALGVVAGAAALSGLAERCPVVGAGPAGGRVRLALAALPVAIALAISLPGLRYTRTDLARHWADGSANAIRPSERLSREAAEWARVALASDGPVMTGDCWTFARYAGLPVVNIPLDRPEAIEAVVEHYGVRLLLLTDGGTYGWADGFADDYLADYGGLWETVAPTPPGVRLYRRRLVP